MKTEQPSLEIVEMIDDEGDAFANPSVARTSNDTDSGFRWVGPAAAIALIASSGTE